jgi:hypothetical protein
MLFDAMAAASYYAVNLRPVSGWNGETPVFDPPLTTAEQAILADLQLMARFGVKLTLTEWRAVKADAAALKAYLGVTSPTAAQTAAATKAIVRVLGTIIRS